MAGRFRPVFFLCWRKTANFIDNEIHVTAETISVVSLWHTTVEKTGRFLSQIEKGTNRIY